MANRKLRIIYRSNSHAPFWLVADKSGVWEKNGLSVDTSPQLVREKAVEALKNMTRRSADAKALADRPGETERRPPDFI